MSDQPEPRIELYLDRTTNGYRIIYNDVSNFLLWRKGSGYSVEILDIQVGTDRRKGIGRAMVEVLKENLPEGTDLIFAITRWSNTVAQEFYEALGFRIIGRLHNFYHRDGWEHAVMYGLDV